MIENLHDSLVNNFCQYAELFFSAKESFFIARRFSPVL